MMRLADCLFAEFRWMWLQQAHGARPGLGRGTPACEQWGKP